MTPHQVLCCGLFCAALLCAVVGCQDHFADPEDRLSRPEAPPEDDLLAAWAFYLESLLVEQCDAPWTCPEARRVVSVTGARFSSQAECREVLTQILTGDLWPNETLWPADIQPATLPLLARSLSSGRTRWNRDATPACLDTCAVAERSTWLGTGQWPADMPCADALVGQGLDGSPCAGGWECALGLVCNKAPLACEGACEPQTRWRCGGDGLSDLCPALYHCFDVSCVPYKRAGDPCETPSDCAPDLGLICEGRTPSAAGLCVGLSVALRASQGQACGENVCAIGLSCVGGRCAPPSRPAQGEACQFLSSPPAICGAGLACLTHFPLGANGLCGVPSALGEPCAHNDQCLWGLRCDNTLHCAIPLTLGSRCATHTDCDSAFCNAEGFCRLREPCH